MSTNPIDQSARAAASALCAMLQAIAEALRADPDFATPAVTILTEDAGDIDTLITQAVGNQGTAVVVMFSGTDQRNQIPGICFDSANFVVEISEYSAINRPNGGRPALEMAEEAAKIIEDHRDPSGRIYRVTRIVPASAIPEGADIAYHLLVETKTVKINRKPKGL